VSVQTGTAMKPGCAEIDNMQEQKIIAGKRINARNIISIGPFIVNDDSKTNGLLHIKPGSKLD